MSIGYNRILLIIFLAFMGCSSTSYKYSESEIGKEELAYIVGTLGVKYKGSNRSRDVWHQLIITDSNGEEVASVKYDYARPWMGDFQTVPNHFIDEPSHIKGTAFKIPIKKGTYRISSVKFWTSRANMVGNIYIDTSTSEKRETGAWFTAKKGEALYIGSYIAYNTGHPFFEQSNQKERDHQILIKKYPTLKQFKLVYNGLLTGGEPYIRSK